MAIQDHFTEDERERQAALTRSFEGTQRMMANPEVRARVEAALERLAEQDKGPRQPGMTGEEFLAWAESLRCAQ